MFEIIFEEVYKEMEEENMFVGYIDNYMKVVFKGMEDMIGKIVKVKILNVGYFYNEG